MSSRSSSLPTPPKRPCWVEHETPFEPSGGRDQSICRTDPAHLLRSEPEIHARHGGIDPAAHAYRHRRSQRKRRTHDHFCRFSIVNGGPLGADRPKSKAHVKQLGRTIPFANAALQWSQQRIVQRNSLPNRFELLFGKASPGSFGPPDDDARNHLS